MYQTVMAAGLDIGNGYMKGTARCDDRARTPIDFPSIISAPSTTAADVKTTAENAAAVVANIYNMADVSFDSPLISNTRRVWMGTRATVGGCTPVEFDVSVNMSKAENYLSHMLALGSIACKALQDYWELNEALPDENEILEVRAYLAVALPIDEYKKWRQKYASDFCSGTHIVRFHNFETPVRVRIQILDTQVLAEGASAQYAINYRGEGLVSALMANLTHRGEELDGVTAADILGCKSTMGIDIGEGTVNFPVFHDGKFNPDASMTFKKGYGNVLMNSMERLQAAGLPYSSRKSISDILMTPPSPLKRRQYNKTKEFVDEDVANFVQEIEIQFTKMLSRVGSYVEVIYVYGGGSGPMEDALYPVLINTSKRYGFDGVGIPVLYLPAKHSRVLNREGLYLIADTQEQKAHAAAVQA